MKLRFFITFSALGIFSLIFVLWNISRLHTTLGEFATKDFRQFWAAGHLFALGGNPYDLKELSNFNIAKGGDAFTLPFYYPCITFSALLPFSLVSFSIARFFYLTIFFLLYSTWFIQPLKLLLARVRDNANIYNDIFRIVALLSFFPFFICIWDGALTLFPFVGLYIFFASEKLLRTKKMKKWQFVQGLSLCFLIIKPNVCFLVLSFLAAYWLRRHKWIELGGWALGVLLLTLPSLMLFYEDCFSVSQAGPSPLHWFNPSFNAFLQKYFDLPAETRIFFTIAALFFSIWRGLHFDKQGEPSLEIRRIMIPLSLVCTPYVWTYDFVVLLFSIDYILYGAQDRLKEKMWNGINIWTSLLLVNNLIFISFPLVMKMHWWYPLVVFLLCLSRRPPIEKDFKLP